MQLHTGQQLSQQLKITPALQQAIRLLQLSNLELQQEVQQALTSNMMLEPDGADDRLSAEDFSESRDNDAAADDRTETDVDGDIEGTPEDLPLDCSWEDIFEVPLYNNAAPPADETQSAVERVGALRDLQAHMRWQLRTESLPMSQHAIAEALIDAVDDDGYLQCNLEELADSMHVAVEAVETVLGLLQKRFEPAGIAARSLEECLMLQLEEHSQQSPVTHLAALLVEKHLADLPHAEPRKLARSLGVREELLLDAMAAIRNLDPRPGAAFGGDRTEYIVPEVYVFRNTKGDWQVRLSRESSPKIRINPDYAELARNAMQGKDGDLLRSHLQEARWLLKSLQSRSETLLKVAWNIVAAQQDFFDHGPEHLKPLVLREIAEAIEMHESTVSRVTSNKYMHTPRGLLPFKYFFSSHVGSKDGGAEAAATAIQATLKKMIEAEDPKKPLSDSKLVAEFAAKDIEIARRTVAKYREQLGIPPSHERKRLM